MKQYYLYLICFVCSLTVKAQVGPSQSVNSIHQNDKTDHAQLISPYPKHSETINLNFLNQNAANNKRYDSKLKEGNEIWYTKFPLWLLAEQPYKPSPNLYLDGSKAIIKDSYPNYYYQYTKGVDIDTEVKPTWLGEATIEFLRSIFY